MEESLVGGTQAEESKDKSSGGVFSRDLYAQRDFWNDRFAESNGHFDWYANWAQLKSQFHVSLA